MPPRKQRARQARRARVPQPSRTSRASSPSQDDWTGTRRIRALLLIVAVVTYGYFHAPSAWNETSRYDLARSIVELHRLDIDEYHLNTGDKSYYDGHYYTDKAPGTTFLALPSYALYYGFLKLSDRTLPLQRTGADESSPVQVNKSFRNGMFVATFFSVGIAAIALTVIFFDVAAAMAVDTAASLLATFALAFGSLGFPYGTLLYGHHLCGALLFTAFALLFRMRVGDEPSLLKPALAGLLASYAVVTEFTAAPVAAALILYGWRRTHSPHHVLAYLAGAIPPALILGTYNTLCFGMPWRMGYQHVSDPTFAAGMSQGMVGLTYPKVTVLLSLLFGTWRGFLWVCPIVLAGIAMLPRLYRDGWRDEALVCGGISAYFLLLNASYYMWWGGSALGPRHTIPALSFMLLPLTRAHAGPLRNFFWVVLAYSVLTMLVATTVGPEAPETQNPALSFYWHHFLAGRIAVNSGSSNFGLSIGLHGLSSIVPLLLIWATIGAWMKKTVATTPTTTIDTLSTAPSP